MNDLERLLIERECTRLLYEYGNFVDFVDPMKAARLLAEDCSLVLKFRGQTLRGRSEFERLYQGQKEAQAAGRLLQRHVITNPIIDVKKSDHATGQVRVTLYRAEWDLAQGPCPKVSPVLFIWNDEFVQTPEGWRIRKHEVSEFAFESPEARWPSPPWAH
ncbi:nuclear transport factor 2 family protein [Bradyrhizobium diazoefficiens]|nr:nuclear transport factor 2 family protein [Bradyrhizobium diazoefficiens]QQO23674.1 nuclear transport factor 2 family protein [Bradyrhizobium diazoefficiens]